MAMGVDETIRSRKPISATVLGRRNLGTRKATKANHGATRVGDHNTTASTRAGWPTEPATGSGVVVAKIRSQAGHLDGLVKVSFNRSDRQPSSTPTLSARSSVGCGEPSRSTGVVAARSSTHGVLPAKVSAVALLCVQRAGGSAEEAWVQDMRGRCAQVCVKNLPSCESHDVSNRSLRSVCTHDVKGRR